MKVLYSLQFLVFVVAPFIYRSARPSMKVFYHRMSRHFAWRRMYVQMLMMFLITFHFYYLQLTGNHYDVLLSSILVFALFSQRFADKVFRTLQHQPTLALAGALTIGVAFVPHLFPLGVTFAVILFGAVFYPSRLASGASFHSLPDLYFRWDVLEGSAPVEKPASGQSFSAKSLCGNSCSKGKPGTSCRSHPLGLDIEDAEVLEYIDYAAGSGTAPPAVDEVDGSPPRSEKQG